jgi:hypothetical protein
MIFVELRELKAIEHMVTGFGCSAGNPRFQEGSISGKHTGSNQNWGGGGRTKS